MKKTASQRAVEIICEQFLQRSKGSRGDRLPGVQELARRCGVSVPTVSKALADLQARGLLEVTRGAGIFIKEFSEASNQLGKKQKSIGFISNVFMTPIGQRVLAGVTRTAALQGCRVELAMTDWDQGEECWHYQNMAKQGLDGVVIYPAVYKPEENHYLAKILRDFPTVVVDLARPEMLRPSIVFDNWKAGSDVTQYLIDGGHRHIAFISLGYSRSVEDRLKGHRRALAKAGIDFNSEYVIDGSEYLRDKNFTPLLDRILALNPRPTAIMAPYDGFARFCIEHLENRKISVPRDMVVTGFDNVQSEEWSHRFPTTAPDFYDLGERAVDTLISMIDGDSSASVPMETLLPAPLIIDTSISNHKYFDSDHK